MVQHRIFIKTPLDVCKKWPSKNQRAQTVTGFSGFGLYFCHWSLKILMFLLFLRWKRFWRQSILSVQKKKVASSEYACARRENHEI